MLLGRFLLRRLLLRGFPLLAAMGAWFGAKFLLALILMSSLVGAVVGIAMLVSGRLANRATPMPLSSPRPLFPHR